MRAQAVRRPGRGGCWPAGAVWRLSGLAGRDVEAAWTRFSVSSLCGALITSSGRAICWDASLFLGSAVFVFAAHAYVAWSDDANAVSVQWAAGSPSGRGRLRSRAAHVLILLLPNGRVSSRWQRILLSVAVVSVTSFTVAFAVLPPEDDLPPSHSASRAAAWAG